MRHPWILASALASLLPASAALAGDLSHPKYISPAKAVSPPVYISQSAAIAQSQNAPGGGWHQGWHGYRGPRFVYSSMYAPAVPNGESADDDSGPVRTQFVAVPYPVPVAAPTPPAPRAPLPTALYSSDGQPLTIPAGARVSSGSVYQYKQGGVNVYTDTPPANGANATRLFGYTEADVPPPGKH
ncbi:MAG: hypothetical protein JSR34_09150 [Proteobacteria bacterium]|nr:hypothetical protein [Pseudomonadota bacterium]